MKLAILFLAGAMCLTPMMVVAQGTGSECTTRCDDQYEVCHNAAESVLELCLDRAEGAHAKAKCAAAFTKLEDACRSTEATCLSNCPS
jgi:hypothetical protein